MSKRIITAIDVGSSKVTTVMATIAESETQPTVIGVYSHPSQGVKKGVIVNIDEATTSISESLNAAERMAGVTATEVYVTINGQQISSLNNKGVVAVSGSEITMDDTYRAIENAKTLALPQDMNPIHVIPREFVVDSQNGIKYPIGMSGQRLEVETHIITAATSSWKNLRKCVEQLALEIMDIVYTGYASTISVLTDTEKELGVALLDIGAGTTSISIFNEGAIVYSGVVPIGGLNITSDLAIGLQLSLDEAEKLKVELSRLLDGKIESKLKNDNTPALLRKVEDDVKKPEVEEEMLDISGLGIQSRSEISKEMLNKIIDARLEEIFSFVKDQVSKAGFDIAMPAGIVITGGTAQLREITKKAQATYGVPARIGYPSGLSGMVEEITDPAYAAVQGLIRHAVDDEPEVAGGGMDFFGSAGGVFERITDWFRSLMP